MRICVVFIAAASGCTWITFHDSLGEADVADTGTGPAPSGPTTLRALDLDDDGATADVDCNDLDSAVYPGALEICDGIDNDCDDLTDDVAAATVDGVNHGHVAAALRAATTPTSSHIVDICASEVPIGLQTVEVATGAQLTVRGPSGPASTVLIPTLPASSLFRATGNATLQLQGLTLTSVTDVAAVVALDESVLDLTDVVVSNNHQAISISGTAPGVRIQMTRVALIDNGATNIYGGAIKADGIFDLRIVDSRIEGNQASVGGAISAYQPDYSDVGSIVLEGTRVSGNVAGAGGGLFIGAGVSVFVSATSAVVANESTTWGGGAAWIDLWAGGSLESAGADWGTPDIDDNVPSDILTRADYYHYFPVVYRFDGPQFFVCGGGTLTCQ